VSKVSDILERSRKLPQVSVHEEYNRNIKNLYSKILKYTIQVQGQNLSPEQQDKIASLKNANMLVVEVLKDFSELRPNMMEFINSDNKDLVEIYNHYRKRIVQVIRGLFGDSVSYPYHGEHTQDIKKINFDIIKQQRRIQKLKDEVNENISSMIMKKDISSKIASSIINDSRYVFRICSNLLKVIELLYYEESDYILVQEPVSAR
jgi:phosphate:Na+ symporter